MHIYHVAMLSAFGMAALLSYKTPRALLWVALFFGSYAVSVLYIFMPKPASLEEIPFSAVVFLLDTIVYIAIREFHRENWEWKWLAKLAMIAVTADFLQTMGHILGWPPVIPTEIYAIGLEAINYLAMALIGGVGYLDWRRRNEMDRPDRRPGYLYRLGALAHEKTHKRQTLRKW